MKAKIGMKVKILDKNTWYEYELTDEEINILKSIDEFEIEYIDTFDDEIIYLLNTPIENQEIWINNEKVKVLPYEDVSIEELWKELLNKEVRCRYCNKLLNNVEPFNYVCNNKECGAYMEQDYIVKYKNGWVDNLSDYMDININLTQITVRKAIEILKYELKDR